MVRVKEWGRGGWGRKEGKACRQILEFWNRPLFMPECAHWHLMLSSAVINWPIKFLVFCGGEMNFWGHLWNQNKVSLYFKSNAWAAEMVKSQWIWTIKAGFKVYLGGRMWQALKSSIFDPWVFVRGQSSARQKLTVLVMAQTTRGALVKVAKNKANPATNEVHVENQNYGLGWSEIGNYRTVTRLLS